MNDPAKELNQVAPTLAELKKLPPEQKDRLFLAKLAKMSRHDSNVLNKHNLTLPGDPYGLAHGYPDAEKQAVKGNLLGAPWTRLVNEGHLVDLSGQGFHKVSEDGHDFLKQEPPPPAEEAQPRVMKPLPDRVEGVPRVFISYSWEGPEHKAWVRAFAERLQNDGIQVIFDRWHLKPGRDKYYFMEQAVAQSDFVAMICTENYADRANKREGGVGWESIIITSEVAEHTLTDKFIPVLRHGSFHTSLPLYLKNRLGVNLSDNPYSEEEYEDLLRQFHGEPIAPPPIGTKPDFNKKAPKSVSGSTESILRTVSRSTARNEGHGPVLSNEDRRLLLAIAADTNGQVIAGSTMDGYFIVANKENFSDNTPRSIATWKRTLRRLLDMGYLSQMSEEVYELTPEGFERADLEEALIPLSLKLSFEGPADKQLLSIEAGKPIKVMQIDLLTTSEAAITTIEVNGGPTSKAAIPLPHEKIVQLFNAPRPDKNAWDHSGPAAVRVVFMITGHTKDVMLPIMLEPAFINNTQWIKLTGSKTFSVN